MAKISSHVIQSAILGRWFFRLHKSLWAWWSPTPQSTDCEILNKPFPAQPIFYVGHPTPQAVLHSAVGQGKIMNSGEN